ncbi:MAG: hypothetical protein HY868_05585 [Chloroflexi bacterium]|nr:hypothetical protein [Chloroflexota bacterium]
MNSEMSQDFQQFHHHVFGDYRYFYYNGLADEICTNLKGAERNTAEELVLKALPNSGKDERPIRAAGHFRLQSAIPILEKLLSANRDQLDKNVKAAIAWATLKIRNDKTQLNVLVDFVINGIETINDLERDDATDLLSEFGKESIGLDALLVAFADKDLSVRCSAHYALYKLFKDDTAICELLDSIKPYGFSNDERVATAKKLRKILNN